MLSTRACLQGVDRDVDNVKIGVILCVYFIEKTNIYFFVSAFRNLVKIVKNFNRIIVEGKWIGWWWKN